MVDSVVSVRRYAKAMMSASGRSECLGLVLVAGRPADIHTAPPAHGAPTLGQVLGPYLGVVRPVAAGHEGAGVVLPEGSRVLAHGLDAQCWPGSEAAFREELGRPAPASWDNGRHARRGGGATNVAARAAADLASYVGIPARSMPAAALLDPEERRGVVVSLPRGSSVWALGRRLVEELGGWPHQRLAVVDALVSARVERAELASPRDPVVARVRAELDEARAHRDEHLRATATARCHDALREVETRSIPPAPAFVTAGHDASGSSTDGDDGRRLAELDDVISGLRRRLEQGDRAARTADAAVRAARAELGPLRSVPMRAPEPFDGWHIERLSTLGPLRRVLRLRRRSVPT